MELCHRVVILLYHLRKAIESKWPHSRHASYLFVIIILSVWFLFQGLNSWMCYITITVNEHLWLGLWSWLLLFFFLSSFLILYRKYHNLRPFIVNMALYSTKFSFNWWDEVIYISHVWVTLFRFNVQKVLAS